MRSFEILFEAKIYGNPKAADKVYLIAGETGENIILKPSLGPKSQSHGGYLVFKFTPEGVEFMNELLKQAPRVEKYGRMELDEAGYKQLCMDNIDKILSYLQPEHTADDLGSQELADFYKQQLTTKNKKQIVDTFHTTAAYGSGNKFAGSAVHVGEYGGGGLTIDNPNHTISITTDGKSVHNRMRGYNSNSKVTYILIDSGYSFDNDRKLLKVLRSLVGKFPELGDYMFEDPRSGRTKSTKLIDLINSPSIQVQSKAVDQMLTKTNGRVIAYHGTSMSIWHQIQKQGAMVPGLGPEYNDKIPNHSEHLIYLTLNQSMARRYGVRAAQSRPAVVLQVEINDMTKLKFDEDSMVSALRNIPDKILPTIIRRVGTIFNPNNIERALAKDKYNAVMDHLAQWVIFNKDNLGILAQKDPGVMSYLNALALKQLGSSGYSFGYKGKIPANKIKMIESFKSQSYNDEKDYVDYENRYDAVKATQQFYDPKD